MPAFSCYINILIIPNRAALSYFRFKLLFIKIINMKKIILLALLASSFSCFAQDSTKVEQYCRLVAINKLFSNKVNIDVDFGDERKFHRAFFVQ